MYIFLLFTQRWLILKYEHKKFLFSKHKYPKQYITKTKYVHQVNWI